MTADGVCGRSTYERMNERFHSASEKPSCGSEYNRQFNIGLFKIGYRQFMTRLNEVSYIDTYNDDTLTLLRVYNPMNCWVRTHRKRHKITLKKPCQYKRFKL